MSRDPGSFGGRGVSIWLIAGWAILVLFAIGVIVAGLVLFGGGQSKPDATQLMPTVPTAVLAPPTSAVFPTSTSLPTTTFLPTVASVLPTDIPPTTAPSAMVEAGEAGVNVRSGPSTNFESLGRLEPGEKATVIGRYEDWWQIDYGGTPGWVAGWVVTAYDTDSVAEVVPPPSPIPPTSAPATAAPAPTATTAPPAAAECRGVVADDFQVEGAPGPYAAGSSIWFNLWITNKNSETVEYRSLGVVADESGQYQQSYSYSEIAAYAQFQHRDRIIINEPGTYHLWLTIGFYDEYWCKLMGPVEVVVQ
jgi:hypothetical protein